MAINIQDALTQAIIRDMFRQPQDTTQIQRQQLALESAQASITPLSNYENNFFNKWQNASRTGGLEDIGVLEHLKTSNENLYNSMTKNISPDKKIPITDSYKGNNELIDKQIKLVNDYSAYKDKINFHYGELETSLLHNGKTLDQLGSIHAKGYNNWEDLFASGNQEDIANFRKAVQPFMEKNGENITNIMQKIVSTEKELSKYGKFSDSGFVSRDVTALRGIATNLGQELRTTTFLTDKEAYAIQKMWVDKDAKVYEQFKAKQFSESKTKISELTNRRNQLVKQKEEYSLRLSSMEKGAVAPEYALGYNELRGMTISAEDEIKKLNIQIRQTGELGATTGLSDDIKLTPLSPAAIEAKKAGRIGISIPEPETDGGGTWDVSVHGADSTRMERTRNRVKKYNTTPEILGGLLTEYESTGGKDAHGTFDNYIDPFLTRAGKGEDKETIVSLDADKILADYSNQYKYNFNRTPEGNAFKKKYNLNSQAMANLKKIESTDRSAMSQERKDSYISRYKKELSTSLGKIEKGAIKKKRIKAKEIVRHYTIKEKVSDENISKIKEAVPEIDALLADFRKAKEETDSKYLTFNQWLENTGNKDKVDYNKLARML